MSTEELETPPENVKLVKKRLKKLQNKWIRTLIQEEERSSDRETTTHETEDTENSTPSRELGKDRTTALAGLVRRIVHSEMQLMRRELTEDMHREMEQMRREMNDDLALEFERTRDEVKLSSPRKRMFR